MRKISYSKFFGKGLGYHVDRQRIIETTDLHNHDFFEIELVVSAKKATHTLNGRPYRLCAGSVYFVNPSDVHSIELGEGGHFERYNVLFRQDIVSESVLAAVINSNCIHTLSRQEALAMNKLFEVLMFYYDTSESQETSEISSRIIETLLLALKNMSKNTDTAPALHERSKNTKSQIQKILLYIHNNFREDITLADIAAYSSFSPHYVSQLFHSVTSSTLTQYITRLRLEYAKNLLFSTEYSITEICYKCGFRSFAHFLRSFKKQYGVSPAKYRTVLKAGTGH